MTSKITGGAVSYLFTETVLGKYPVKYYRCEDTGFIQTEEPFWLKEAYASAITSLDLGILFRNEKFCDAVSRIIVENFSPDGLFLDYAGGYGIFTRMMRDRGFDFYHTDKYCENLFAKHFELSDLPEGTRFELATCFELFEHLADPMYEIALVLQHTDSILFSTELVPDQPIRSEKDWWYIAPETGQHIAFYTRKALEFIAEHFNLQLYSNNHNLHLLTAKKLRGNVFWGMDNPMNRVKPRGWFSGKIPGRPSLLQKDFNYVKSLLNKGKS